MAQLPIPCLTLVTDRTLLPDGRLLPRVAQAVAGGVDAVQLREKELPAASLLPLAQKLRQVTRRQALLLINSRVDVALACDADGVQLAEDAMPLPKARRMAGPQTLLLGRSVHSVEGAVAAEAQGADFLLVGTIFPSRSHLQGEAVGPALLEKVGRAVSIPFFGIGGITSENIAQVMEVGAHGAAVIEAILGVPDPARAATELRQAMLQAWVVHRAASGPNTASAGESEGVLAPSGEQSRPLSLPKAEGTGGGDYPP